MTDITLPTGRLVQGHPMDPQAKKNDNGTPKMQADGVTPLMETFIAVAIAKAGEQDWKQTAWGQQIAAQAAADWPNGEYNRPDFAWKIIDGDSAVPNKRGVPWNSLEGFPGHWVVRCATTFGVPCYYPGRLTAVDQIQDKTAIKRGDYVSVSVSVKGNGPVSQSPGLYLNPRGLLLVRAGQEIVSASAFDAGSAFANVDASALPPGAQVDPNIPAPGAAAPGVPPQAPAAAGVAPAPDFLQPQVATPPAPPAPPTPPTPPQAPAGPQMAPGCQYTYEQLKAAGYDDAAMRAAGYLL